MSIDQARRDALAEALEGHVWETTAETMRCPCGYLALRGDGAKERYLDHLSDALMPLIADWAAEDRRAGAARLEAVREYVDDPGNWSALDGRRKHLLALIDGETK